jgi:hypothetical protein
MKILIKTLNGDSFNTRYEVDWDIGAVKEEVAQAIVCDADSVRLIFEGKQLEDFVRMADLAVTDSSHFLVIVLKVSSKEQAGAQIGATIPSEQPDPPEDLPILSGFQKQGAPAKLSLLRV